MYLISRSLLPDEDIVGVIRLATSMAKIEKQRSNVSPSVYLSVRPVLFYR